MRQIALNLLVPGMKLGKTVYGPNGETYLNAGVILNQRYINRLSARGYSSVYVEDRLLDGVEVDDVIRQETRVKAISGVRSILKDAKSNKRGIISQAAVTRTVNGILDELLDNPLAMVNLVDIRSRDDYLFGHCVNVCVLAVMTGITLGFRRDRLLTLGTGALLHDVGKVRVPPEILDKPEKLSAEEFEVVKKHTIYGRDILRQEDQEIAAIAYSHHERYNGEGYPEQAKHPGIKLFSQIVGVVDIFDAITSDRCYKNADHPRVALELLAGTGNWWFDAKVVNAFMENVAAYPTGTFIQINTGEVGIVMDTPKGQPFFPNVRILLDREYRVVKPYDFSTLSNGCGVNCVLDDITVTEMLKAEPKMGTP